MPDRLRLPLRLPLSFDPQALQSDLHTLDRHAWIDHFVAQNYEGTWSVLPLRGPADAQHPVRMIYGPTAFPQGRTVSSSPGPAPTSHGIGLRNVLTT